MQGAGCWVLGAECWIAWQNSPFEGGQGDVKLNDINYFYDNSIGLCEILRFQTQKG